MAERPEACSAWQEDLAGWLTADLAPDRETLLDAHLAGCATCRGEAESLLDVVALSLGAELAPVPRTEPGEPQAVVGPPPELAERVASAVASERRARRRARLGVAAVAGAAAAAVLAVVLNLATDSAEPPELVGEPVTFTVVPAGSEASALVAPEGEGSVLQLTATGLDPEVTYAMWLSPPGGGWDDRVAAGTFRPRADGTVDVRLPCALPAEDYGRAWATTPDGDIALDTE
jgi:anti-sigma factor RsiW